MAIERDHPNPDIRRNLIRARDIRAAYLHGLLLWMAVRARDWVARRLGDRNPEIDRIRGARGQPIEQPEFRISVRKRRGREEG
jgi:hypothetical protein